MSAGEALLRRALALGLRALAAELEAGTLEVQDLARGLPDRDLKPEKVLSASAPRRPPAARTRGPGEAGRLVAELERRHGTLRAAAEAGGFAEAVLRRWRSGRQRAGPSSLQRLRRAVRAGRARAKRATRPAGAANDPEGTSP